MKEKYKDKYKPLDLEFSEEKDFKVISCPKCSCETPSTNINLAAMIAKCDNCNALFSIKNKVLELQSEQSNEEIAKPVGIDILEYNGQLELTLDQPLPDVYVAIAGLIPFLILLVWFIFHEQAISSSVFLSITSALVFAFVYALVNLFRSKRNKIFITVTPEDITIEYRPNNLIKDKVYFSKNIEQLFVKTDHQGRCLHMIINEREGQKSQKLLGSFSDITKAKYVEQEIERYLGIKNKRIAGEEI